MGLFRRKPSSDEREDRCPHCAEPLPEDALECMMCGNDLRPLRGARGGDDPEPPQKGPGASRQT